jgi:dephospho-CoA kinase
VFGIGLTGGIGSGKTSVSDRLAALGAEVVDADVITHEIQRPDGAAFEPIVRRFGEGIVAPDGSLDRPALARIVFNDPVARSDLTGIVWPLVTQQMRERAEALAKTDHVAVFSIPIMRPENRSRLGYNAIVVVDCPTDVAVERLVAGRGMDREDALARIAAQVSREERLGWADFVVDNSSTLQHLDAEIARLWAWIEERRGVGGPRGAPGRG